MWQIALVLLAAIAFIFYVKRDDGDCECFQNYLMNTFYKWPNCNKIGCLHRGVNAFGVHPRDQTQSHPFRLWTFNNSGAVAQHHYDSPPIQTRVIYKHW